MADSTQRYYPEEPPEGGVSLGTILFGLILLAIGLLWLLDLTGTMDVTWTVVGAVLLILVGIALFLGAREGSHGGLVFVGTVLSVIVLFGTLVTWPSIGNDVGERAITPDSAETLESSYSWGAGEVTVDLSNVDFPEGETDISVRLGAGVVLVYVPREIAYQIDWQAGIGDVVVIDRDQAGFGLNGTYESEGYEDQPVRVSLDVQVGVGTIEVRQ